MGFLETVIAGLIVAGISGGVGYAVRNRRVKRNIEQAPKRYAEELEKIITVAVKEGRDRAIVNGRAIVATCNDLKATLMALRDSLNSEIERLGEEVGASPAATNATGEAKPPQRAPSAAAAYETIEVLAKNWPAKRPQIENQIRKIIAELRLDHL